MNSPRIFFRGHGLLGQKLAVHAGHRQSGRGRLNIHTHHPAAFGIQMQKGRLATARQIADRPLLQPAFRNQPLGDRRHGAALQSRVTHQISPGHGLVFAHQIQHDAAVDVADRFTGRHLKVVQINFAHKMPSRHCSTGLVRMSNFIRSWLGVKDKVRGANKFVVIKPILRT